MKIVNGIMAQLPYTPPRTQLCIVELEDNCLAGSGVPTTTQIDVATTATTVKGYESAFDTEHDITFDDITVGDNTSN